MENKHLYTFKGFALNLKEKSLSQNGEPVSIPPKVFAILEVLIKNEGRIVEKDELMKEVWADSFVEESNLTYSIRQLRKILDDDFHAPEFIETVPRRGYRFIGKIENSTDNQIENPLIENSKFSFSEKVQKRIVYAVMAISVLLFVISGYFYYQLQSSKNIAFSTEQQKLAILPFTNLQPNSETDFLGFAFADTLNTKLTSMRTFKVYPSSLMTKFTSPQDFLKENESEYIVSGTYLKEDGKLLITAQVFGTRNNETLFQDSFELGEEQLSQTSEIISRRLINELRLRPQEISNYANLSEINPNAYNYFSKGIEQYSRFKLAESIENLEKAVQIEPNFAIAWDKLGDSYLVTASTNFGGANFYQKAENAYRKSINLAPDYTLPQIHLTNILTETNRKEEAIEILLKALETEAENPMVWWELSYAYRYAGRLEKSIQAGEKAHQTDPGFFLNASSPNYYLYIGDYQKFKNSLSRRTDSAYLKFYQGFAEYHLNNKEAAKQLFDEAFQLDSSSMQTQIGKVFSLIISNENEKAKELLLKIESEIYHKKVSDGEGIYKVAQAFAVFGDKSKALKLFGLAVEKGFFCYPYFQNDLMLNNIRSEKEFTETLGKAKKMHEDFKY
jgi:DNA-binding winged helix-turn-helix (wHTH) protein/tetratricopeptide (TPR) repeat protein